MEITLAMRVLDAMASELETLKERIEMAEAAIKELQGGCSCQTWRVHTSIPRDGGTVAGDLTQDEVNRLLEEGMR